MDGAKLIADTVERPKDVGRQGVALGQKHAWEGVWTECE